MRKAVQITGAAVIAAVLMTGCGSSGDDKDKETGQPAPTGASKPAEAPKDKPAETPAKPVKAADLAGSWGNGGKHADNSLQTYTFTKNMVVMAGKDTCTGQVVDNAQPVTLTMKNCPGRTTGTVKGFDGKSLTVSWEGGKEDKLTKVNGIPGLPAKPGS
ncbi:hypothetical protein [Streptomyces griseocarneus]|uniref:hypothetical protein n=1 Tax=Streptomyces griseocarneus TaxID=51201 RepID=UPI00167E5683|nr:hypothetical protein [Streptomyces griseocarneus]MBZ6477334.1 hypothetical protein [Streptomyces griseocarneus]GHG76106.1 hypothetical protein GCM10018779_54150 [Streptomyces griseocarneus]